MKFSILIANYNNGRYFRDCYNSIISQTYTNWEVVIVDDDSTDNSLELIRKVISGDDRFQLFTNVKNHGCGFTKRKCVELSNGEVCGFVDPDDAITPDALKLMMESHSQNSQVSLVHSSFYYCNEELHKISNFDLGRKINKNEDFTNLDGSVTHFASFKKLAYNLTEGINIKYLRAVDQDLYLKLFEVGEFYFLPRNLYLYRLHKDGISSNNSTKAFYYHIKALIETETRRNKSFENEVEPYLNGDQCNRSYYENQLNNPGLLLRRSVTMFRNNPAGYLKKLFLKSNKFV